MKLLTLLFMALLLIAPTSAQQADPCGFSDAVYLHVFDYDSMTLLADRVATDADRAALMALDGIYDWVGYEHGGFDRPPLEWWPVKVQVTLEGGDTRYVYLYDERDNAKSTTWWVWAFVDLEVTTDANGEHRGAHHICASGGWPAEALAGLTR